MARPFWQDEALMSRIRVKQRAAVGVLGKHITRRSRGCCELCDQRDQTRLFELAPFPEEPDPERTLMTCARCRTWLEKNQIEVTEAHFLGGAVWSDKPAVRLAAARMLLCTKDPDDHWLQDALDVCRVDPQTLEFHDEVPATV